MSKEVWTEAAGAMIGAGQLPMPVTDTLVELLKTILSEEEAAFITRFARPSMNIEEIRERCGLDGASLEAMLDGLLRKGALMVSTSRGSGVDVYRLMPPFPGLFEYTMMKGETGEREKRLAFLYEKLFEELAQMIQANYDSVVELLKTVPPMTRVVPVECDVDVRMDSVMPCEDAMRIVDKFDVFAVSHCYCRHTRSSSVKPAR